MAELRQSVRNVGDPEQVKDAKRRMRDVAEQERDDWTELLTIPAARRRIWDLIGTCGVFRNAFNADAITMAFATGQQNIGLTIIRHIESANPTALVEMMTEAATEERKRNV